MKQLIFIWVTLCLGSFWGFANTPTLATYEPFVVGSQEPPLVAVRRLVRTYQDVPPAPIPALPQYETERVQIAKLLQQFNQHARVLNPELALFFKIHLYFRLGRFTDADEEAQRYLQTYPKGRYLSQAYYFQNKSRFLQQKPLRLNYKQQQRISSSLPAAYQTDFFWMLSEDAKARGNDLAAIGYLMNELQLSSTLQKTTPEQVLALIERVNDLGVLQRLQQRYPKITFIQELLPYQYLDKLIQQNNHVGATQLLNELWAQAQRKQDTQKLERLSQVRQTLQLALKLKPYRIGVILPLSFPHPYVSQRAQESVQGIHLALRSQEHPIPLNPSDAGKTLVTNQWPEFLIRDSAGNPEEASRQAKDLILNENVIALIGPLLKSTSEAVAAVAEAYQVPMISMSLSEELVLQSKYVFRNHQSASQEIHALVDYAMTQKGMQRFAILYPDTKEGVRKTRIFWEAVEKRGGEIVGAEKFQSDTKNFIQPFEEFTGMNRPLLPGTRKVTPIADFEGIFIPIEPYQRDRLRLIVSYPQVYQVEGVTFLGDSHWNHSELLLYWKGVPHSLLLADPFWYQANTPEVQQFLQLYEQWFYENSVFQRPSHYMAYAYDSAKLVLQLLASHNNHSHDALQQALLYMKPYLGVTGKITFHPTGEALHQPLILSIQNNQLVQE